MLPHRVVKPDVVGVSMMMMMILLVMKKANGFTGHGKVSALSNCCKIMKLLGDAFEQLAVSNYP